MNQVISFVWCILIHTLDPKLLSTAFAQATFQTGHEIFNGIPGEDCTVNGMECRCLFDIPPEHEEPPDVFSLIANGPKEPQQNSYGNSAIIFLGMSGSGVTTSAHITAGNLSKLHSLYTLGHDIVIVDEDDEIGLHPTVPKTIFPKLIIKNDTEDGNLLQFFDFPTFDNKRPYNRDIVANTFMSNALQDITEFKIIFVLPYTMATGNDRMLFDYFATHAAHFVNDISKFNNSIALVVSKVINFDFSGRYIKDSMIIYAISNFLDVYRQVIINDLNREEDENERENIIKKIILVENFLQTDEEGNYPRIRLIRRPIECGRLSDTEAMQSARSNITEMLKLMQPTIIDNSSGESAFNLNFQQESISTIFNGTYWRNLEPNSAANEGVSKILTNFKVWYESSNDTNYPRAKNTNQN